MRQSQRALQQAVLIIVLAAISIVSVAIVADAHDNCEARGGALVRGVWPPYVCVQQAPK